MQAGLALAMALLRALSDRVAALEGSVEPALPDAVTTIKSAAFVTGFSQTTIRNWIAAERISARKVGGRTVIDASTLPARSKRKG